MSDPADIAKSTANRVGSWGTAKQRKRRRSSKKSRRDFLNGLLRAPINVVMNGKPVKMPTLGLMMRHLLKASSEGDKKATRLLPKFERWARRQRASRSVEIIFVESEYTRSLSPTEEETANG